MTRRPPAVCLDAYNTLVTLDDPAGHLQRSLATADIAVSRDVAATAFAAEARLYLRMSLCGSTPERLRTVRRAGARELWRVVGPYSPRRLSYDEMSEVLLDSLHFAFMPGALECLRDLSAAGVRVALVSNWDLSLERVLNRLNIRDAFDAVVISACEGVEKPDPRIWIPALAALGRPPAEVWHAGDDYDADVVGARLAGLRPVLVGGDGCPEGDAVPHLASLAELPALVLG